MHTHGSRLAYIALALVIVVAVGIGLLARSSTPMGATATATPATYMSADYGYSFAYPGSYIAQAYSPEYVAIGTPIPGGLDAAANVDLATALASDGYASYESFVHTTAMNDCAADGPGGSISCTAVASSSPYTSSTGLSGEEFYLTQVATAPGEAPVTTIRGPFYAFNISSNVSGKQFAALIIHPAISGDDASNTPIVAAIADSLTIDKTAPTTTTTATSTPANWEAGMQVITASGLGQTVSLAKNERFVIQLGDTLTWSLTFDPAGIISRVPNSTTADGIQGVYEADAVGTTTLHAIGAPICKAGEACPQFRQEVEITFVVR